MQVIATYGMKGGVGKTSAAVNLAALSAADGNRTLLWDLDPQGAAGFLVGVKPKVVKGGSIALLTGQRELDGAIKATDVDGLDLLPADISMRAADSALDEARKPVKQLDRLLKTLKGQYDVVVLDCPPGLTLLSENVFAAVDVLLIPLIPSPLSVRTFGQLEDFFAKAGGRRPLLRPFLSMVDGRKRLHADVRTELAEQVPSALNAWIPSASAVERMGVTRRPLVISEPSSRAALAYRELWAELAL